MPRRSHPPDDNQLTFEPIVHIPVVRIPQPDGSLLIRPGKPVVLGGEDEIGTAEAAKILGCEPDWVGRLCERGTLLEGRDWRRIGERGNYKIKRASVIALAHPQAEQ